MTQQGLPAGDRYYVVILDDDAIFLEEAKSLLRDDFRVSGFTEEAGLWESLEAEEPDVLLLDIWLEDDPDGGFRILEQLRDRGFGFPVILLTMKAGLAVIGRALELGVPFLQKDAELDGNVFRNVIGQSLRMSQLQAEIEHHRRESLAARDEEECPWPESPTGSRVRRELAPYLEGRLPIFLIGEAGTGKKTTARWIRSFDGTPSLPRFEFTLRGLDPGEAERALFGFVRDDGILQPGLLAAAATGSLILEGLECMTPAARERLRLAIEAGTYSPAGGERRLRLRCRILGTWLAQGDGWPDEFPVSWKPMAVHLPPLRDHPEDLEFHARFLARRLDLPGPTRTGRLNAADFSRLRAETFPGNFGDLKAKVLRGADAAAMQSERIPEAGDIAESDLWDMLSDKDWRFVEHYCLQHYCRRVGKRIGRNIEAWMEHTGFSRATVYRRFLECLDSESPEAR